MNSFIIDKKFQFFIEMTDRYRIANRHLLSPEAFVFLESHYDNFCTARMKCKDASEWLHKIAAASKNDYDDFFIYLYDSIYTSWYMVSCTKEEIKN